MARKQSAAMDKAKRDILSKKRTVAEACRKYELNTSAVYKTDWWKAFNSDQKTTELKE